MLLHDRIILRKIALIETEMMSVKYNTLVIEASTILLSIYYLHWQLIYSLIKNDQLDIIDQNKVSAA